MCRAGINLTYQAKGHMNILFCHPGTKTLGNVFHPKIFVLVRHDFSTGTTECIWTLETLQHEPKGFFFFLPTNISIRYVYQHINLLCFILAPFSGKETLQIFKKYAEILLPKFAC